MRTSTSVDCATSSASRSSAKATACVVQAAQRREPRGGVRFAPRHRPPFLPSLPPLWAPSYGSGQDGLARDLLRAGSWVRTPSLGPAQCLGLASATLAGAVHCLYRLLRHLVEPKGA